MRNFVLLRPITFQKDSSDLFSAKFFHGQCEPFAIYQTALEHSARPLRPSFKLQKLSLTAKPALF